MQDDLRSDQPLPCGLSVCDGRRLFCICLRSLATLMAGVRTTRLVLRPLCLPLVIDESSNEISPGAAVGPGRSSWDLTLRWAFLRPIPSAYNQGGNRASGSAPRRLPPAWVFVRLDGLGNGYSSQQGSA